jgi:hypothetical protein
VYKYIPVFFILQVGIAISNYIEKSDDAVDMTITADMVADEANEDNIFSIVYGPAMTTAHKNQINAQRSVGQELAAYLQESAPPMDSNPLDWWKVNQIRYPKLAKAAKHFLGIPATSVPSERLFSKSGQALTNRRNRLSSTSVNMVVFLNCNK